MVYYTVYYAILVALLIRDFLYLEIVLYYVMLVYGNGLQ